MGFSIRISLAVGLGLLGLALAQTDPCEEKEAEFQGCVGQARRSNMDPKKEEDKALRKEKLKIEQAMCLTTNGCFGDPEDIGNGCLNLALNRAKSKLEKCTGTDLTKVLKKKRTKKGAWGKKSGTQLKALRKICPGGKKFAKKAFTCMRKKKRASRKEAYTDRKSQIAERKKIRASIKECEKNLGRGCLNKSKRNRKKAEEGNKLCDCAQKLKSDISLAAELESCATLQSEQEGDAQGETAMDAFINHLCLQGRLGNGGEKKKRKKKKKKGGRKPRRG